MNEIEKKIWIFIPGVMRNYFIYKRNCSIFFLFDALNRENMKENLIEKNSKQYGINSEVSRSS